MPLIKINLGSRLQDIFFVEYRITAFLLQNEIYRKKIFFLEFIKQTK